MGEFPSCRWPALERILRREPLGYSIIRQTGSHRTLRAPGRPELHLSFHERQEISGGMLRKILVRDVGLTEEEALALL